MLSKADLDALRKRLEARLGELDREIAVKRADASADRSELQGGNDNGDLSTAEAERDVDIAEVERDLAEARLVQAVMGRIDDGNYGSCADCGLEIPAARLRVQPLALRCITCQERAERRAGEHHSSL
jgi:DnaK suppressor protein